MSNKNYVVETWIEGEGFHTWSEVSLEQLEQVEGILGTDFIEDITINHSMKIRLISDKQSKQSKIQGALYDGYSQKNAERLANGLEPLDGLED